MRGSRATAAKVYESPIRCEAAFNLLLRRIATSALVRFIAAS